jgi:hypothetical protein
VHGVNEPSGVLTLEDCTPAEITEKNLAPRLRGSHLAAHTPPKALRAARSDQILNQ